MGVIEDLARARAAYERRDWVLTYDALSGAGGGELAADDFHRLAIAAHLVGRHNDCIQAFQRAFAARLEVGDRLGAARAAFWLAMVLMEGGEAAVADGWVARCRRLLDNADVVERGYLLTLELLQRIFSGRFEETLDLARQITACGRRFDDPDLVANGLNGQGRMLIYSGRVREGLTLLDEAMAEVSTGRVSTVFAGEVYCSLIEACQELADFSRAAEWTSALTQWIDQQPGLVRFTGQCAVHRGQIMRVRGEYGAALEELQLAVDRYLAEGHSAPAGVAFAEQGDVLRILGRLSAAEAAYEAAVGQGHEPQPGLALLRLAQGRTDAAEASVRRLLAEPRGHVQRCLLLPAAVEVTLAVGHPTEARVFADELSATAEEFGCSGLQAMATQALGAVLLTEKDPASALAVLRTALGIWRIIDAPYDAARCRVLIGQALSDLGDDDSAAQELAEAHATFVRIGAKPDAHRLIPEPARRLPGGLTEREVEVLRLVATGKSNPQIATALVLSEKTVARHLSNIFGKLDVSSRTAAAAYAFEHRLL